jgi:radical SAM protein with 4Fe4S-binding SPASM domain
MQRGLDRLVARAEEVRAPLSVLFELTGRCNLDCGHCYLDIAHPPDELSTADAIRVVDRLADAGTLFLTLSGGELFLRPDALVIAAHARRRGLALRLYTNATRVTRALAQEIARLRPLSVEVSIYGTHGVLHDAVTRRHALRRTLRGLVHLRRAGVNLVLKTPLVSVASEEVDALAAWADRLSARIAFDPFIKTRTDGNRAPVALRADLERLARAMVNPRAGTLAADGLGAPPDSGEAPCAIGRRTAKVSPTGDVYPCGSYPQPIGNLLERSFGELWAEGASPVLDRLRAMTWGSLTGDCAGCAQSGYCNRCSAAALVENGDENGPSREACRIADAKELALGVPTRSTRRPDGKVKLRVVV